MKFVCLNLFMKLTYHFYLYNIYNMVTFNCLYGFILIVILLIFLGLYLNILIYL